MSADGSQAATATEPLILVSTTPDGIATVVLNRADRLNALSLPMWRALGEAVRELSADSSLRCLVLRGAGTRAFSPGADIAEFASVRADSEQAARYGAIMHGAAQALAACPCPVIAQIHGLCIGGGLELAAAADLRVCGSGSRFGVPVKRLGLTMAYAEMKPLIDLVGYSAALDILFTGRMLDADEALRLGLVNHVVADDAVAETVAGMAAEIAAGAPLVARWHKRFARKLRDGESLSDGDHAESFACFDTEDFKTGYRSFLAKQPPIFRGR